MAFLINIQLKFRRIKFIWDFITYQTLVLNINYDAYYSITVTRASLF